MDTFSDSMAVDVTFISSFLPASSEVVDRRVSLLTTPLQSIKLPSHGVCPVLMTLIKPAKTKPGPHKPIRPVPRKSKDIPPTPQPPNHFRIPFVSYILEVFKDPFNSYKLSKRYGPIYTSDIFGRRYYVVTSTDLCAQVLKDNKTYKTRYSWPKQYYALLGDSMFNEDGEVLVKNRSIVGQAFKSNMLRFYFEGIKSQFEEYWKKKAVGNQWHPLDKLMKENTFRVISQISLGEDDTLIDHDYLNSLFDTLTKGMSSPLIPFGLGPYGRGMKANRKLNEVISHIIDETFKHRQNLLKRISLLTKDENEDKSAATRDAEEKELRDLFRRGELSFMTKVLSEVDISTKAAREYMVGTIIAFWVAATETTASSLASALLELSDQPELLEQLQEEQEQLMRRYSTRDLTYAQLEEMPLLTAFMYEIIRTRYAPETVYRRATRDTMLGGYLIPKGSYIAIDLQSAVLDPTVHKNPEVFDVSRFLPISTETVQSKKEKPMESKSREPIPLLAFGAGPHHCVGYLLAKTEFRALVSLLLRNYDWELKGKKENIKNYIFMPTLHPEGVEMRVTERL